MLDEFVATCGRRGIVLDTNLLLLTFVGAYDRSLIERFKRTLKFAPEEFDAIARLVRLFSTCATTPHILTEVVDLAGQVREPARHGLLTAIRAAVSPLDERYFEATDLVSDELFPVVGLADTSVLRLCSAGFGLVTDDFPLASRLAARGLQVLNFNTIRPLLWE